MPWTACRLRTTVSPNVVSLGLLLPTTCTQHATDRAKLEGEAVLQQSWGYTATAYANNIPTHSDSNRARMHAHSHSQWLPSKCGHVLQAKQGAASACKAEGASRLSDCGVALTCPHVFSDVHSLRGNRSRA